MQESKPQGIRSDEGAAFLEFFEVVQAAADADGKVFFVESGEGHEGRLDGMELEDLSGWLVDREDVGRFTPLFEDGRDWELSEMFADESKFVEWSIEGGSLKISFV